MTDEQIEQAVLEFRPLADWWANRIQWSEEDHEDLVQEGLFHLFKTLKGYQRSGRPIRDLKGLASACLAGEMKWYYRKEEPDKQCLHCDKIAKHCKCKEPEFAPIIRVPAENAQVPVEGVEEFLDDLITAEFVDQVGKALGPVAQMIVKNLVVPGPEVIQLAMEEMCRKAERRQGGERVVGHSTLRITKDHVRRVSKLSEGQWQKELSNIQQFTESHLGIRAKRRNRPTSPVASQLSLAS